MAEYRVMWEADVEAENPEAAARYARAMQTRPGTTAVVFDVYEHVQPKGLFKMAAVRVDLIDDEHPEPIRVDQGSDLATVLAALRHFQREYEGFSSEAIAQAFPEHFTLIAAEHGDDDPVVVPAPLGTEDIDDLCERLNCGGLEPQASAIVTIVGGVGEVAETSGNVKVEIIDYDNLKDLLIMGQPGERNLLLSPTELAYIRKHDDAFFVARVEAALAPSEA